MAYLEDADFTLHVGDAREVLATLPTGSVDCCVTSPPYWGLRDYGTDGQLGLEPTPDAYVASMVAVFREVRRVLADHGTLWLNLGDSYASGEVGRADAPAKNALLNATQRPRAERRIEQRSGLKQKDLVGVPWRVAFALQQDGWYLRSDIVWSKPNPMPESVTDRPTKAHEMVFLLAKAPWKGPPKGQFGDITDEDARWLALLFDTEGNIVIKRALRDDRTQFGAQMAFANCSRALLERAQSIVGAGSIHERTGQNAPVFYWQMAGRQARDLLYRIYPFLIVKQRQARVAIHMQDVVAEPKKRPGGYRTAEHEAFLTRCWQTVKALNQFGDPDLSWVPAPKYGKWGEARYWFDQEAVREPHMSGIGPVRDRSGERYNESYPGGHFSPGGRTWYSEGGRNVRSVWEIATQPYPEGHFATFPEELARRCVVAGCPEWVCGVCGKPRERLTDVTYEKSPVHGAGSVVGRHYETGANNFDGAGMPRLNKRTETTGWSDCGHNAYKPGVVLDPFLGSGTVALVARKHGRHTVGIELNETYAALAARRLQQLSLLAEIT